MGKGKRDDRPGGRRPQASAEGGDGGTCHPPSYPESYLQAARRVAAKLAARHTMAFFSREDLTQELVMRALVVFPRWDPGRDPGPFLQRALSRHVHNLFRDRVRRSDSPCPRCKAGRLCGRGEGGGPCRPHAEWAARWGRKALLMRSGRGGEEGAGGEPAHPPPPDAADAELLARLDAGIPAALRADFLRLKQGMALPPARKAAVLAAARAALNVVVDDDDLDEEDCHGAF